MNSNLHTLQRVGSKLLDSGFGVYENKPSSPG
jgi:hypothetical protein